MKKVAVLFLLLAMTLAACVPIGVKVQNMYTSAPTGPLHG